MNPLIFRAKSPYACCQPVADNLDSMERIDRIEYLYPTSNQVVEWFGGLKSSGFSPRPPGALENDILALINLSFAFIFLSGFYF